MPRIQEQLASLRSEHRELAATIEGVERAGMKHKRTCHPGAGDDKLSVCAIKFCRTRIAIAAASHVRCGTGRFNDSEIHRARAGCGRASSVEQLLVLLKEPQAAVRRFRGPSPGAGHARGCGTTGVPAGGGLEGSTRCSTQGIEGMKQIVGHLDPERQPCCQGT